jgi:nucleoside-diphosphate-sugar epimerase
MAKTVLLTGAFGNIGQETLKKLLAAGHSVVCLDRETPQTRQVANAYADRIRVAWGDIADESVLASALEGVDCVVHLVGIIPPMSEQQPELAERVNVGGTRAVIAAMERSGSVKRLIFASTIGVFGQVQDRKPPLLNDSPVSPDDTYGRTKVVAEESIRASTLDWTILRICAAPPVEIPKGGVHDSSVMFEMSADARVEFVHPDDVSTAFCNAVSCDGAIGKTLFLGGGKECQFLALDFANNIIKGNGISSGLPASAFKPCPIPEFYGDWVDTDESQRLLNFQNYSMDHYAEHIRESLGWKYYLVRLISPLAKRALLKSSAYYGK